MKGQLIAKYSMTIKMFDKIDGNNWNLLKYNWDAFDVLGKMASLNICVCAHNY